MIKGIVLITVASVIYGIDPALIKILLTNGMSNEGYNCYASVVMLIFAWILSRRNHNSLRIKKGRVLKYLFVGVLGLGATGYLLNAAYLHLPVGMVTVIHFVYPVLVLFAEIILSRSRLQKHQVLIMVLTIGGFIVFAGLPGELNAIGFLLAAGSAIVYATYIVMNDKDPEGAGQEDVKLFYMALGSGVVFGVAAMLSHETHLPAGEVHLLLFGITLAAVAFAYYSFIRGITLIGGEKAAFLSILEPIASVAAGRVIFHDVFGISTYIGSGILILAAFLTALPERSRP